MNIVTDSSEQLTLLPSSVPARFQLSEATRRRGRRHAAEIRAQLAERRAAEESNVRQLPRRPGFGGHQPSAA